MPPIEMFLWGFGGSAAVEIITLYGHFNDDNKSLPARYCRIGFWIVRLLLAVIAGGLALAYNVKNPILTIHVGAATPLIVQTLARTMPEV